MATAVFTPNHQSMPFSEALVLSDSALSQTRITAGWAAVAGTAVEFTCESPEAVNSDTPRVLLLPGLLSEQGHYDELRGSLARLGAIAITYSQPAKQDLAKSVHPTHWDAMKLQSQVPWAVMKAVSKISELQPPETSFVRGDKDSPPPPAKYFLAGHSMGGYVAARLANTKPEHVEGVIQIAGAGMKKHNLLKMGARTVQFNVKEALPIAAKKLVQNPYKFVKDGASYSGRLLDSLPRRVREIAAVATCDIRPYLIPLKAHGIDVHIGAFKGDHYSPVDENKAVAEMLGAELQIMDGNHLSPQKEAQKVASFIFDAVFALRGIAEHRRKPNFQLVPELNSPEQFSSAINL